MGARVFSFFFPFLFPFFFFFFFLSLLALAHEVYASAGYVAALDIVQHLCSLPTKLRALTSKLLSIEIKSTGWKRVLHCTPPFWETSEGTSENSRLGPVPGLSADGESSGLEACQLREDNRHGAAQKGHSHLHSLPLGQPEASGRQHSQGSWKKKKYWSLWLCHCHNLVRACGVPVLPLCCPSTGQRGPSGAPMMHQRKKRPRTHREAEGGVPEGEAEQDLCGGHGQVGHVALVVDHKLDVRVLMAATESKGHTGLSSRRTECYFSGRRELGAGVPSVTCRVIRGKRRNMVSRQPLLPPYPFPSLPLPSPTPLPLSSLFSKAVPTSVSRCNSLQRCLHLGRPTGAHKHELRHRAATQGAGKDRERKDFLDAYSTVWYSPGSPSLSQLAHIHPPSPRQPQSAHLSLRLPSSHSFPTCPISSQAVMKCSPAPRQPMQLRSAHLPPGLHDSGHAGLEELHLRLSSDGAPGTPPETHHTRHTITNTITIARGKKLGVGKSAATVGSQLSGVQQ